MLVVHDECVFNANDDQSFAWGESGRDGTLKPKGDGAGFHASQFLSEKVGTLAMTEDQHKRLNEKLQGDGKATVPQEALVTMKIGKVHKGKLLDVEHDGYWTNELLMKQLDFGITIFEELHPGSQGLFLFDNSTGHGKYADGALRTPTMNLYPGGETAKDEGHGV